MAIFVFLFSFFIVRVVVEVCAIIIIDTHTHTHTARIPQRQRDTATHARIDALDKLIDAFGETIRIIATSPPPPIIFRWANTPQ